MSEEQACFVLHLCMHFSDTLLRLRRQRDSERVSESELSSSLAVCSSSLLSPSYTHREAPGMVQPLFRAAPAHVKAVAHSIGTVIDERHMRRRPPTVKAGLAVSPLARRAAGLGGDIQDARPAQKAVAKLGLQRAVNLREDEAKERVAARQSEELRVGALSRSSSRAATAGARRAPAAPQASSARQPNAPTPPPAPVPRS